MSLSRINRLLRPCATLFGDSTFSGVGRIPSCHGAIWTDRQTDRQADRQADGWTTAYTGRAGIMSRGKHYTQRPNDTKLVIAPGAVRRYATADGSSTRGGSTSVRGPQSAHG